LHESDFSSWSYFALADSILKYSSAPERDLIELFKRLVFNIAVYNNDDHLRNFGFLYSGHQNWNLSPLYDVVPSQIRGETYSLAMTLGADGKRASFANAVSMCGKFRLSSQQAIQIIENIKDVLARWQTDFTELGVSRSEIKMLENSFILKP
jgi:serine/threonine-protein kinase HipA